MQKETEFNNGTETLKVISDANNFNRWMYETIKPFCKGHVLEIGSGIGNISQFLLSDGYEVTLSDINSSYLEILDKRFSGCDNFNEVILFDFAEKEIHRKHSGMIGKYDTIIALNVLEHIDDHEMAVKNCLYLMKPGANLIILVPAFESLYNEFDRAVEHQRRYSVKSLNEVMSVGGFNIIHTQYFNLAGILGWYVSGKMFKRSVIPGGQMSLYNKLVPFWKVADRLLGRFGGLSLIGVAERTIK
ncbi:MAG: class I SAM-dependent methyltransferase [Prolixibacteraceae bacterium]|jgi:SAM-dependent methyltransferase|nr:class I SAM-dependent methyltransferase [Prolixibacteraceae bacterium]NLO02008.1 class I SAM-dependent methyltransferase [Bacteroidales bacterium]